MLDFGIARAADAASGGETNTLKWPGDLMVSDVLVSVLVNQTSNT